MLIDNILSSNGGNIESLRPSSVNPNNDKNSEQRQGTFEDIVPIVVADDFSGQDQFKNSSDEDFMAFEAIDVEEEEAQIS